VVVQQLAGDPAVAVHERDGHGEHLLAGRAAQPARVLAPDGADGLGRGRWQRPDPTVDLVRERHGVAGHGLPYPHDRSGRAPDGVAVTGSAGPGDEPFCYLTTTGRVTGRAHTIEIWFGLDGATIYLLSGGGDRSDWVRNLASDPEVTVRVGGDLRPGRARVVTDPDEDRLARSLLLAKYQPGYGGDLTSWSISSLPVAVDTRAPA
jgi:deazaflavin-dependent oxidoreductase (nitroreductase family)